MLLARRARDSGDGELPVVTRHVSEAEASFRSRICQNSDAHVVQPQRSLRERSDVGQVITWHPADALEQSEACRQSRKTKRRLSSHSARHSLAYELLRHNPPR